jgi:Methylamine utilisation protein MauE
VLYDVLHDPMILAFTQAILMLIFLAGAWSKLRARETFEGVVYNYRLLPEFAVRPVSYLLPVIELAVGLGVAYAPTRPYAVIGALLLLTVFNIAIAVNLLRGRREIDCGCFSSVLKQRLSTWLIVRNTVLMGLAAWLAWGAPQTVPSMGWLDWLVGLAAALLVAFIYMTASLLATQAKVAHNTRQAR